MRPFETPADTRLSVFDSPKGLLSIFKSHKNINLYFKRRRLKIFKHLSHSLRNWFRPQIQKAVSYMRDLTVLPFSCMIKKITEDTFVFVSFQT